MSPLEFTYEDEEPDEYEVDVFAPQKENVSQNRPFSLENISRVAKGTAKHGGAGFLEGLGGTLGSLLQMAGLQSPDISEAERARYIREFEASPRELAALSEADEPLGYFSRLPTTPEVSQLLQKAGVGAPTGFLPKLARRAGQFAGGGATFGSPALAASTAAGAVGQGLEEAGAPPWAQTAGELITFLKTGNPARPVTSRSPEVAKRLKEAKRLGATEEEITLLKNGLEERGLLKKTATETGTAAEKFKTALSNTEANIENVLAEALPGYEAGSTSGVKKAAAELFDVLGENAATVKIKDTTPLIGAIKNSVNNLSRTLSLDPKTKEAVTFLNDAVDKLKNVGDGIPADFFTNWYKKLNGIGQWVSPKEKEVILSKVKNAIKDTLKQEGPAGSKLAADLEDANKSWMRYLAADDAVDLIKKSSTEEGINWAKLSKSLSDKDNLETLRKGIGKEPASNLKQLADNGKDIKELWKDVVGGKGKEAVMNTKGKALAYAFLTASPGAIVGALKAIGLTSASQQLATKLLTDPKYQNLTLKLMKAVKEKSPVIVHRLTEELERNVRNEEL